ncbi:MAG: serine protease, partial [Caldilinea sp.]
TLVWQLDTQVFETTVTYQTQVGLDTRGVLTNTVVATLDLLGSSSTTAAAAVEVADVILDISISAPKAVAVSPITYTFTIVNEGVSDSDPLTVQTVVPVNALHRSGGTVDADGVVTWQLPPLAAGDTTEVQMAVDVLVGMTQLGQTAQVATAAAPDIVGGGLAEPGEWPWQVALLNKAYYNVQFCGGSLIAPDLVLTAAHCLERGSTERVADRISVWVGAHDLTELDQGQIIDISYAALHTNYDPYYTLDYDIALLRLAEPAQLSATVQPVQLATRADEDRYRPGTVAAVTGWGSLAYQGQYPDILHEVSVGIVDQNQCKTAYSTLPDPPNQITDRMICAGFPEGGKDSCQGDSGGPLVV